MTPEQFEKLPRYAKSEINVLRSTIRGLETQVGEMLGGGETKARLRRFRGLEDQPVPTETIISFEVRNDRDRPRFIECRLEDNSVYIHGEDSIQIEPSSSNTCSIKLRPR